MDQDSSLFGLLLPVGLLVLMYFLLIRPQQKRTKQHKEMLKTIAKNDEVITNGGIVGTITSLGDTFVSLRIANNTIIKLQKHAISGLLPKGTFETGEGAAPAKKSSRKKVASNGEASS